MTNAEARFNKIHIRKVYAFLAVTCHLHFWQNDRDFLRATVVTRRWNGYPNKSQHKSRPWRRKFSRRSSRDSNPRPFNHESGALTTELSPPRVFFFFSSRRLVFFPLERCNTSPRVQSTEIKTLEMCLNVYLYGSRAPEVFADSANKQWRQDTCLHHQVSMYFEPSQPHRVLQPVGL